MKITSGFLALALAMSSVQVMADDARDSREGTRNTTTIIKPTPTGTVSAEVRQVYQRLSDALEKALGASTTTATGEYGNGEDTLPPARPLNQTLTNRVNLATVFGNNATLFRQVKDDLLDSLLENRKNDRESRQSEREAEIERRLREAKDERERQRLQRELEQELAKERKFEEKQLEKDKRERERLDKVLDRMFSLQSRNFTGAKLEKVEAKMGKLLKDMSRGEFAPRNFSQAVVEQKAVRIETVGDQSRITYTIRTDGTPSIRIKWTRLADNGTAIGEYQARVKFHRLAEVDATHTLRNTTRSFTVGTFNQLWTPLAVKDIVDGGVTYKQITTSLVPGGAWGAFNLTLAVNIATDVVPLADGSVVQPNGFKYSVYAKGWPYAYTQGRLALVKHIETSARNVTMDPTTGLVQLDSGVANFQWDSDITADGRADRVELLTFQRDSTVQASGSDPNEVSGEISYRTAFVFPPRANEIVWDPETAVSESSAVAYTGATSDTTLQSTVSSASKVSGLTGGILAAASALAALLW